MTAFKNEKKEKQVFEQKERKEKSPPVEKPTFGLYQIRFEIGQNKKPLRFFICSVPVQSQVHGTDRKPEWLFVPACCDTHEIINELVKSVLSIFNISFCVNGVNIFLLYLNAMVFHHANRQHLSQFQRVFYVHELGALFNFHELSR